MKAECVISKVLYWIPKKYINRSRKKFNISRQDTKWNDSYSALSIFYLTGNYLKVISLGKKLMIYQCQLQRCSIHLGAFNMWQKIALFTLSILESTRRHKSIEVMTSPDKQHLLSWDKHKIIIQVAYIWVKKKSKKFPKSWNKNLMPIIFCSFKDQKWSLVEQTERIFRRTKSIKPICGSYLTITTYSYESPYKTQLYQFLDITD